MRLNATMLRRWLALCIGILASIVAGLDLAFTVYSVELRSTLRLTQTEVEMVSLFGMMGFLATSLVPIMGRLGGINLIYGLALFTGTASLFFLSCVVRLGHSLINIPIILAGLNFLTTSSLSVISIQVTSSNLQNWPLHHSGKIRALILTTNALGKVFYVSIFEKVVSRDVSKFFLVCGIIFLVVVVLCSIFVRPLTLGLNEQTQKQWVSENSKLVSKRIFQDESLLKEPCRTGPKAYTASLVEIKAKATTLANGHGFSGINKSSDLVDSSTKKTCVVDEASLLLKGDISLTSDTIQVSENPPLVQSVLVLQPVQPSTKGTYNSPGLNPMGIYALRLDKAKPSISMKDNLKYFAPRAFVAEKKGTSATVSAPKRDRLSAKVQERDSFAESSSEVFAKESVFDKYPIEMDIKLAIENNLQSTNYVKQTCNEANIEEADSSSYLEMLKSPKFHLIMWPGAMFHGCCISFLNNVSTFNSSFTTAVSNETLIIVLSVFNSIARLASGFVVDTTAADVQHHRRIAYQIGTCLIFATSITLYLTCHDNDAIVLTAMVTTGISIGAALVVPIGTLVHIFGKPFYSRIVACYNVVLIATVCFLQTMVGFIYDSVYDQDISYMQDSAHTHLCLLLLVLFSLLPLLPHGFHLLYNVLRYRNFNQVASK